MKVRPHRSPGLARVVLFILAAWLSLAPSAWAVQVKKITTAKGIVVWFAEDHTVPVIAMDYAFAGGAAQDPADKQGLANFLSTMLDEGAGDLDSAAFQEKMEELAFSMSHTAGKEWFSGSFRTLTKNRAESFRLLALALNHPRFDEGAIERMRRQLVVAIRNKREDPEHQAWMAFRHMLFGDHPYARDADGTEEGVRRVTRADLVDLHRRLFAREHLLVSVAGDISAEEAARFVDMVFGELPMKSGLSRASKPRFPAHARERVIRRPIAQTIVLMGNEGLLRSDPDFIPAYVANFILGGGGFGSRLTEVVREKNGLAYSVYSAMFSYRTAGVFFAQAGTRNAQAMRAKGLMLAEIRRLRERGVGAKELADAKRYLIGSWPLRFDSTAKISALLLALRREGLGIDYIEKRNDLIRRVDLREVNAAAKRLLHPDRMQVLLFGDPAPEAAIKTTPTAGAKTPARALAPAPAR